MSARNRRRRAERRVRPAAAVMAERAVVRQPPVLVSTYAEPTAERVTDTFDAYSRLAFSGNGVVFGSINFRMKLFGEARLCWRDLDDKSLTYKPGGELARFVKPWPNGTTGDLLTRMEQDASLAGNAYVRDCGNRLERLRPDWVTIVSWVTEDDRGHEVREVIGYMYDPTGDPERKPDWYPVEEVAHWAPVPDPLANWRGMSWLTPVIREINADKAMVEHQDKFYRNAATPNIIIKYTGKMTGGQKIGLAESIAARHGGPDKAGGTLVLDEGADPMIVGSKLSDSQFTDALSANENRIAVASGVPAMVIGLKEGLQAAAWSMYRQACRAVVDTTLRPNWRGACAALSTLVDVPAGFELWFDTRDIAALQEGETEIAATMQVNAATSSSFIAAGFEPESVIKAIVAGDMTLLKHTGLVSVQLLPPGTDPAAQKADAGASDTQRADLERAFSPGQRRDAKGRWTKGGGGVAAALESGADDALDGFSRETLRREAKRRGITLRRGASEDEIKDALHDHNGGEPELAAEVVRDPYGFRVLGVGQSDEYEGGRYERLADSADGRRQYRITGVDGRVLRPEMKPMSGADARAVIRLDNMDRDRRRSKIESGQEAAQLAAPVRWNYGTGKIEGVPAADRKRIRTALSNWATAKADRNGAEPSMNAALRGKIPMSEQNRADIEAMDRAMDLSKLPQPVTVYRGFTNGQGVLPADSANRDLTGHTWTNQAFMSVTTVEDAAEAYAGFDADQGFAMRMVLPAGSSAVAIRDEPGGLDDEGELVIPRDGTYRVLADRGLINGTRWLDVERVV